MPPSAAKSAQMSRVKNRHTAPEMAIRRELHRRGLRYRVNMPLPQIGRTRPDIVFTRARVAVFIDGCFWHRCPEHGTAPKTNPGWWRQKLDTNVERDRRTDTALAEAGWTVIRIWEHEDAIPAADRVEATVRNFWSNAHLPAWGGHERRRSPVL
ncbi:MAG: very short patch repair endonuclease [bacterium]|nr:very short patch repair endonuclease [bacterium]